MKIYEDAGAVTSEEKTIYFLIFDGHRADIVLTVPPALQNSLALLTSAQARTSYRRIPGCKHSSRCNSWVRQRLQCNPAMELAKRCQDVSEGAEQAFSILQSQSSLGHLHMPE